MTFDRLRVDAVNRATDVHEYASGKSINAARVAHTLGKRVVATGFLGGDSGHACRRDLHAAGIAHDFVPVAARTRMCITAVDRSAGTATELIEEPGAVTPPDCDALLGKLTSLLSRATALVLSGSLAPGVPPSFYASCVRAARVAGVASIVDAKGEPLRLALAEGPSVVKPNRQELEETTGVGTATPEHLRESFARLVGNTGARAVVTMGAEGAVLADGDEFTRITVPRIKAVSPIGSGDSLAGGLAAGLSDGLTFTQAACFGCACAVANALTEFAGHVRLHDVERLRQELDVHPL
jgi:1-phosphofructokinase family hexose kinase